MRFGSGVSCCSIFGTSEVLILNKVIAFLPTRLFLQVRGIETIVVRNFTPGRRRPKSRLDIGRASSPRQKQAQKRSFLHGGGMNRKVRSEMFTMGWVPAGVQSKHEAGLVNRPRSSECPA
jgi:hypothetical protein